MGFAGLPRPGRSPGSALLRAWRPSSAGQVADIAHGGVRAKPDPISQAATHRAEFAPQSTTEPARDEMPEWVKETPELRPYHLMAEGAEMWEQDIELSRLEYAELKRHLAVMRGHVPRNWTKPSCRRKWFASTGANGT